MGKQSADVPDEWQPRMFSDSYGRRSMPLLSSSQTHLPRSQIDGGQAEVTQQDQSEKVQAQREAALRPHRSLEQEEASSPILPGHALTGEYLEGTTRRGVSAQTRELAWVREYVSMLVGCVCILFRPLHLIRYTSTDTLSPYIVTLTALVRSHHTVTIP